MITKIIQESKMSFFDKINNYLIVSSIKEILTGRDPEESLPDNVQEVIMLRNLQKWDYKGRTWSEIFGGHVRNTGVAIFSTGEAHAPPVKHLKNALNQHRVRCVCCVLQTWRCTDSRCRKTISLRKGSFFERSHLMLRQCVDCLYWWSLGVSLSVFQQEVSDYRVCRKSGPETHDHNSVVLTNLH